MKTKIVTVIVLALLSLHCMSQPPAPPDGRRQPPPPGGPGGRPLQQVTAFTGQATGWAANDDYVYDGLYLQTAQEKLLVKFPAHLGTDLTAAIKNGSSITVNGTAVINPAGEKEVRMISINAGGKTIYDSPPAIAPVPPAETVISGSGKITALQKNREGDINGYLLDNKTMLRIPPHVVMQLSQLAVTGGDISYTGFKKQPNTGEVATGNYTIVHAQTITINGTQYLTR